MTTQTARRALKLGYLKTIGIVNNAPTGRGFANPVDLVVARDGRIFVLNRGAYTFTRVGICNLNEEYLGEFSSHGEKDGQLKLPTAIAMDSKENVYVADEYTHRISIFDSSGKFLGKWGSFGSGEGQFNGPAGLALDAQDNAYVVDQHNHRIQKYTADGRFLAQWGSFGSGDGQFNMPWGITVGPDANVYVADWRNDRIQKFSPDGRFLAKFGRPGQGEGEFHRPSKVAVDTEGYIYVADWGNERVQVLRPDGKLELLLRGQATLSRWAMDFFASNQDEWRERQKANLVPELPPHLRTPYHTSSQTEPYFWGPTSVNLDREGRLYVTETSRHRIQIYQKQ